MLMFGIYKITNKQNNKIYIGKSKDIEDRWIYHTSHYNDSKKWDKNLYKAFRKYGIDNFSFEIIEPMDEETYNKFGNNREQYWIIYYDSFNNGYNETSGGDGGYNVSAVKTNSKLTKEEVIQIRTMYNNCNICVSDAYELFKDKITKRGFQAIWLGQNHKTIMPEVFTEENKKKHNYLERQRTGRLRQERKK